MYNFKSNFIQYISTIQKITYILNCSTNEITELDTVGTELLEELLKTTDEERAKEILEMFEECDFFEKRSTCKV